MRLRAAGCQVPGILLNCRARAQDVSRGNAHDNQVFVRRVFGTRPGRVRVGFQRAGLGRFRAEDMAENGVTIGVGPYTVTATSTSGECRTTFDIKPTLLTGHYSCKGSTGYNNKTGQMGKVDIEVDFKAGS